jgi:zinc and cadmium transporter
MHPLDIHWVYTFGSVALIAAVSFTGMVALSVSSQRLSRIIPLLVSLAAGTLLGTAFGHLLPESIERVGAGRELAGLLLAGFVTFFVLEKFLGVWCNRDAGAIGHTHQHIDLHHSHQDLVRSKPAPFDGSRPMITNVLAGAAIHSVVDGMAIGVGYSTGTYLGVITTTAVLLHEAPHHIGDVSILIHRGVPIRRAVMLNLMAASTSALGALVVLLLGTRLTSVTTVLLPFTTANFVYIASASLMPELQQERGLWRSLAQTALFLAGSLLMFASFGGPEPH